MPTTTILSGDQHGPGSGRSCNAQVWCARHGTCTAGGSYSYYSDFNYLSPAAFAVAGR